MRALSRMPVAWICSRHGATPEMPRAASASATAFNDFSCRTVAVLIESGRRFCARSRIGSVDAVAAQHRRHPPRRELGIGEEAGGGGEAEELGEMEARAGALLAADHDEMALVAVE